jgi:hypothetical protein
MAKNEQTENRVEMPLADLIQNFVVPNCYLQCDKDTSDKGGVAIPYIVSKPGAGKTSVIEALCKNNGWGLMSVHFALKPIEELGGIPNFTKVHINGKEVSGTEWTVTDMVTKLWEMHNETKEVLAKDGSTVTEPKYKIIILLYDDAHLCGPGHMAFFYEPFTERTIRGHKLPPNCAQAMAGNDSNKAGAKAFFSAITNRCARLYARAEFKPWKEMFALPKQVHPAVVSFLGKDNYQFQFFHGEEVQDSPWASPRSWTRLANFIEAYEKWNGGKAMPASELRFYAEAHVGKSAGNEFSNYYSVFTKFNLDRDLDNFKNFQLPSNDIDKYAFAFAITAHYCGNKELRKVKSENFAHILFRYLEDCREVGIVMMKDIMSLEKIVKDENIFGAVAKHLEKLKPTCVTALLQEVARL